MKANITTYTEVEVTKEQLIREITFRMGKKCHLLDKHECFDIKDGKFYGIDDWGNNRGGVERKELTSLTAKEKEILLALDCLEKHL